MKTFDDISVQRPALAQSYLSMLTAQPGRPLALFAPRRVGKTYFLDNDLAPNAKKLGLLPVYADLWLYKAAPLEAINHALEEVLDELSVPQSAVGKVSKTPVKSVGVLGVNVAFGEEPSQRSLPTEPTLRFDALIVRIAKIFGGKVLLLLDEVQTLGEVANGVALIAAIRAVLHKQKNHVYAVFTGSSQEGLSLIMNTAGAPMYQFAQIIDFPFLGDEYLKKLVDHFRKVHLGKTLELDALRDVFASIGYRPALMRDIVKAMSAEGIADTAQGLENFMRSDSQVSLWKSLLNSLDAFEVGVLQVVVQGEAPLGQAARKMLSGIPGANPTIGKVRTTLDKLKRKGILSKTTAGTLIDDPLFAQFILRQGFGVQRNGKPG
jgi:hypothetical protein